MTLPYDIARCEGRIHTAQTAFGTISAVQAACVRCLRRTDPGHPARQVMIVAPEFQTGKCPSRLPPADEARMSAT